MIITSTSSSSRGRPSVGLCHGHDGRAQRAQEGTQRAAGPEGGALGGPWWGGWGGVGKVFVGLVGGFIIGLHGLVVLFRVLCKNQKFPLRFLCSCCLLCRWLFEDTYSYMCPLKQTIFVSNIYI